MNPLKNEIIKWNNQFPIDRWWRKKYGIAYGSKAHLEADLIDQLFEYYEDYEFQRMEDSYAYIGGTGDWMHERGNMSDEQRIESLKDEAERAMAEFKKIK